MVDSIGNFDPIAYIQGINKATAPVSATGTSSSSGTGSSSGSSSSTGTGSSSSATTLGLSSAVLSLLQGDSASSQNGVNLSTILGDGGSGVSSGNPLAGVYNALLSNATLTNPLQTAVNNSQQQNQVPAQTNNPVQKVLNAYNNTANAATQALVQNAQAVAADNNFGPDGKTPLVA